MASYTRLGSYLLAVELTSDPSGKISRGLALSGNGFDRHFLIRTFTDELMDAGIGTKLAEAKRAADLLAGIRGVGTNYHCENGKAAHVVCDYVPGRSLTQVLKKTREEQIPLGVDHALSVLQGMAQSIIQLHGKGLNHGTLSPHSIWLSYEGATEVLDAPYGAILHSLLPKARHLQSQLIPYRPAGAATPLQQDLYALGAVLYELLTLETPPSAENLPGALAKATLKAAQEDGPIPAEILALLRRLLLLDEPFTTATGFSEELEKVLYDGEYSPTTFNMAFFMHTLFREEADADTQAMKADQAADFTPFLSSDAGNGTGSHGILQGSDPNESSSVKKYAIIGGAVVVLGFGALLISNRNNSRKNADLQEKIVSLQRENAANDAKLLDLGKAQEEQKRLQDQLTKKALEGKTVEERNKAKKDLEEAKQKNEELSRQREEALRKRQELNTRTQVIAQAAPPTQEPPKMEAPKAQEAPKPVPAAQAPAQQTQAQASSTDIVVTSPSVIKRVAPVAPRLANKNFLPPGLRDAEIKVTLKVFVDIQGRPLKVVITRGVDGPFGYNDAAQNAALATTFAPAQRNGKPITAWLNMEFNFGRAR